MASVATCVVACGPSYESTGVKTPEELVAEQERLAMEQEQRSDDYDSYSDAPTESEERKKFDKKQSKLELQRATRSAKTCPDALPEEEKKKVTREVVEVSLVFSNEGHVKSATLPSSYDDTALGACLLRAMEAVIVPAYVGPEVTVNWEIDLTETEQPAPAAKKAEEGKE